MPIEFLDEQPMRRIEFIDEPQQPAPSTFDTIANIGTSALKGATLGLGEEAIARAASLSPNVTYEQALEFERQKQRQFQEQQPLTAGLSEAAGAITGGLAAGVLAAPTKAAQVLSQLGGTGRIATGTKAVGLGGVSGGLYAFGSGEGGASQRLAETPTGMAYGAGGGLAGLGVAKALRPLTERASRLYGKIKGDIQPSQPLSQAQEGLPISGKPQAQDVSELMQSGKTTDMLKGAQTQNVDLMRQEELARQGLLGDELEVMVRNADDAFKQSVKDTAQALAGKNIEQTSNETLAKSIKLVKNRYDAEKRLQNVLMTKRNDAIAKSKVYADYTKDTLGNSLDELKKTPDMMVNLQVSDNAPVLERLKIADKIIKGSKDDIDMSQLSAWRRGLNSFPKGTQQAVLAKQVGDVYDNWLDSHLKLALKEGDETLADKIFSANKAYAEFKNKYGTDKFKGQKNVIERIMREDDLSPRAMVNTVFGKSMDGKDYTNQFVKRMVNNMPEGQQRQKVVEGFRAGLMQKTFEDAYDDVNDVINIGKFKNNLIKMRKNDAFNDYLTTPEHSKVIDGLIEDLNKYQRATSDKSIVNLSGTTPMAARIMQSIGAIPIVRNISFARGGAEAIASIAKAGTQAKDKRAVEKSLAEFYKTLSPEMEKIQIRLSPAFAGGAVAAPNQPNMIDAQGNEYIMENK